MILTAVNHKGGVGKTTTAINLGAALVKRKLTVLLVDFDPQANLTQSLRVPDNHSILDALNGVAITPHKVKKRLYAIPSRVELAGVETKINEHSLRTILSRFKGSYDVIIIDPPPSLGTLTINALVASDYAIIPIQPHYLSVQGLKNIVEVIGLVQERLNPALEGYTILVTQYNKRRILHRQIYDMVASSYGVFNTPVRDNISIAEAPAVGKDIFAYNPKSHGAHDYFQISSFFAELHETMNKKY